MFADAAISTTIDRLIYLDMLNYDDIFYCCADTTLCKGWLSGDRRPIKTSSKSSDELHAHAFYDFEGAGRFIRFIYLVGNNDSA